MAHVLYIHGFLSSPKSFKARATRAYIDALASGHHSFDCPQLSSYPHEAKAKLLSLCEAHEKKDLFLIGSSLGGFWATYLIEKGLADKAVLVNPAVLPQNRFREFIDKPIESYYNDDVYTLQARDIDDLAACDIPRIKETDAYWLLAQKGDEVLDYRLAAEKYSACRQHLEDGGNHSFEGFENMLPLIGEFFGLH